MMPVVLLYTYLLNICLFLVVCKTLNTKGHVLLLTVTMSSYSDLVNAKLDN